MAGAFQRNAFQNNAFQTSGVTSTLSLPLPINCVLIGQQLYRKVGRTLELVPGKAGQRVRMSSAASGRISSDAPSFTVKSNAKGYD